MPVHRIPHTPVQTYPDACGVGTAGCGGRCPGSLSRRALPAFPVSGAIARDDYFRVDLTDGEAFDVAMDGPDLSDFDLLLYSPYATWETLEYAYVALAGYVGTADARAWG